MARIKDTSVEAVKAAADFVDVVSARTQLRKAGARYSGRCPFHEDRSPSFSVNAVDKLYYCFGCGAKGDLITFVRDTEGLDFAGAIEWLGERFHVPIEYEESSPAQDAARKRRDRLYQLLDQAATYYERTLWESQAGGMARDYLKGRGLNEETSREFRLGLALGGTTLARKALEKGFTREELRAAGLTRQRGDDYFQRRRRSGYWPRRPRTGQLQPRHLGFARFRNFRGRRRERRRAGDRRWHGLGRFQYGCLSRPFRRTDYLRWRRCSGDGNRRRRRNGLCPVAERRIDHHVRQWWPANAGRQQHENQRRGNDQRQC
jgi:DNA primase